VVDDDPELRASYRSVLGENYLIHEAENGIHALGVLSEHQPDLILSDVNMPDMGGTELLRQVRSRDLDVPVILITGDPELDSAMSAVNLGAWQYLVKPVDPTKLMELVHEAVGLNQMALAKREAFQLTSGRRGTASDHAGQVERFESALASLFLHFQPIWSAAKGGVHGFECLLRCNEPSLKSPPDLIRIAEELGRIDEVGRAIRAYALSKIGDLPGDCRLFVNLHYSDLDDPELFDASSLFVDAADRIVLEITERESLQAIASAEAKVEQLRAFGFEIAMDDLGAGHNGLAAFTRLAPEVVKLDMQLVRGVDQHARQLELVKVMRDYCERQGMAFIAEGVETRAEYRALTELGVDLFQGYFIARPGPEIEIPENPES